MIQAAFLEGQVFDLSPPLNDDVVAAEVGFGGGDVAEALMVAAAVVVLDEGASAGFEVARRLRLIFASVREFPTLEFLLSYCYRMINSPSPQPA